MRPVLLITGAGGAAAVSFIKALRSVPCTIYAADMDPMGAGLYLVPEEQRVIIPPAGHPDFASELILLCAELGVDVLIPTVDAELLPLAASRPALSAMGTRLMCAPTDALTLTLDKYLLAQTLGEVIPVPRTELIAPGMNRTDWSGPVVCKPRRGAGSRGIRILDELPERLERDDDTLVQEYLPGTEYSVDVLADRHGLVLAAVPRERMKVDSGVAVASRTVRDPELERFATLAVETLGLPFISNVQFRRDAKGLPRLLEINPRTPGTMPLTVASGVNMPVLALRSVLGTVDRTEITPFRELATVRFWTERFIDPSEITALAGIHNDLS